MQNNKYSNLNVEDFKRLINTKEYLLIDVRTEQEQKEYGVIDGTNIHIDCNKVFSNLKYLKLDKTKKYLLYCWHGNRSKQVQNFMKNNGFPEVHELDGGIDAWNKQKTA